MQKLLIVFLLSFIAFSTSLAFADNMVCSDSHVLVERTNGKQACLTETTAEKVVERLGWEIIAIEHEEPLLILQEVKSQPDYQNLDFAINSDGEYTGAISGHYEPESSGMPPIENFAAHIHPNSVNIKDEKMKHKLYATANDHFGIEEIISLFPPTTSTHPNAINYLQILPTWVPEGFELYMIDTVEPGDWGNGSLANFAAVRIMYFPDNVNMHDQLEYHEYSDLPSISLGMYKDDPKSDEVYDDEWIKFINEDYGVNAERLDREEVLLTITESPGDRNIMSITMMDINYSYGINAKGIDFKDVQKMFDELKSKI